MFLSLLFVSLLIASRCLMIWLEMRMAYLDEHPKFINWK